MGCLSRRCDRKFTDSLIIVSQLDWYSRLPALVEGGQLQTETNHEQDNRTRCRRAAFAGSTECCRSPTSPGRRHQPLREQEHWRLTKHRLWRAGCKHPVPSRHERVNCLTQWPGSDRRGDGAGRAEGHDDSATRARARSHRKSNGHHTLDRSHRLRTPRYPWLSSHHACALLDRSVASRRVPVEAIAISNAHAITLLISQSSSRHLPQTMARDCQGLGRVRRQAR